MRAQVPEPWPRPNPEEMEFDAATKAAIEASLRDLQHPQAGAGAPAASATLPPPPEVRMTPKNIKPCGPALDLRPEPKPCFVAQAQMARKELVPEAEP